MSAAPHDKDHLVRWLGTSAPESADCAKRVRTLFARTVRRRTYGAATVRRCARRSRGRRRERRPAGRERRARQRMDRRQRRAGPRQLSAGRRVLTAEFADVARLRRRPVALRSAHDDGRRADRRQRTHGHGCNRTTRRARLRRGVPYRLAPRAPADVGDDLMRKALDSRLLDLRVETPRALVRSLRQAARVHAESGGDWRDVVEAIRDAVAVDLERMEPSRTPPIFAPRSSVLGRSPLPRAS